MLPMIPAYIACLADSCYPTKKYTSAFLKANKETPPSSCAEKVITGVSLAILAASCSSCCGCVEGPAALPFCEKVFYCIPACTLASTPGISYGIFEQGLLSTGCARDYTVLKKTFTKPSEILPPHQMDRIV